MSYQEDEVRSVWGQVPEEAIGEAMSQLQEEEEIPMEEKFLNMTDQQLLEYNKKKEEEEFGPEIKIPCVYQSVQKEEEEEEFVPEIPTRKQLMEEAAKSGALRRLRQQSPLEQWRDETLKQTYPNPNKEQAQLADVYYMSVSLLLDQFRDVKEIYEEAVQKGDSKRQHQAKASMMNICQKCYAHYHIAVGHEEAIRGASNFRQRIKELFPLQTKELPELPLRRSLLKKKMIREFGQDPDQIKLE